MQQNTSHPETNIFPALLRVFAAAILILMGVSSVGMGLAAQESGGQPDLSVARSLLAMPDKAALEAVKKFNADEAEILTTQLLSLARARNPDVDRVYALVRHLEILRADAHAQNRLNTLLYVLGLTLILFTGFLLFVMIDQRRSLRSIQTLLSNEAETTPENSPHTVYRGD